MYEFWYDYVKLKYREKAKLCNMDIDSCIVYIKAKDTYVDIAKNAKTRFDTVNSPNLISYNSNLSFI